MLSSGVKSSQVGVPPSFKAIRSRVMPQICLHDAVRSVEHSCAKPLEPLHMSSPPRWNHSKANAMATIGPLLVADEAGGNCTCLMVAGRNSHQHDFSKLLLQLLHRCTSYVEGLSYTTDTPHEYLRPLSPSFLLCLTCEALEEGATTRLYRPWPDFGSSLSWRLRCASTRHGRKTALPALPTTTRL